MPVTCLYAGKPELQDRVIEAIRVHQNNDMAMAFGVAAARILEAVLLGSSLSQALDKFEQEMNAQEDALQQNSVVLQAFQRAKTAQDLELTDFLMVLSNEMMKDQPDSSFYNMAARSCALPGSFSGPIHQLFLAATSSSDQAYPKTQRNNIMASGDTCSRAILLGAIVAAATGGPPQEWMDQMDPDTLHKVNAAAMKIAEAATQTTSS